MATLKKKKKSFEILPKMWLIEVVNILKKSGHEHSCSAY